MSHLHGCPCNGFGGLYATCNCDHLREVAARQENTEALKALRETLLATGGCTTKALPMLVDRLRQKAEAAFADGAKAHQYGDREQSAILKARAIVLLDVALSVQEVAQECGEEPR